MFMLYNYIMAIRIQASIYEYKNTNYIHIHMYVYIYIYVCHVNSHRHIRKCTVNTTYASCAYTLVLVQMLVGV